MNHIVFIGNSLAAVKAIEEIRKQNPSVEITIVTDGFYPYDREKILAYLGKEIKEKQAFLHLETFYKEQRVKVMTEQTIARINFRRNQVVFENKDKEQLEYDVLVLADLGVPRRPIIKGNHKEGVFNAVRLKDIKALSDQLPFIETVVVQMTSLAGFKTLCALSNSGKEVIASVPSADFFQQQLDADSASILKQLLEQSGVRLMFESPIEEILGDTEVKAVRFKSGKVFAADLVILDDVRLDTRIIKESGLELTGSFQANFKNVYFLDAFRNSFQNPDTNDYAFPSRTLTEQGSALAAEILGQPASDVSGVHVTQFHLKGLRGCWAGTTRVEEGGREFFKFDAQKNVYKKIFAKDNSLSGAVLFNAEDVEIAQILELLEKQINILGLEERLLEGPLDMAAESKSSSS